MKVVGKFELESIEVRKTVGDEYGIYFAGEGQEQLAFPYHSAKKVISSAKKLKEVLGVKYNISAEVEIAALNEEEQETNIQERGKRTMSNKKRKVNVKQLCRECIDQKMTSEETLVKIAAVYTGEGKDEKYALARAKSVYSSIRKEKGLAPLKKILIKAKKEAETEPECPTECQEEVKDTEVSEVENTEVQGETEPESEELEPETEQAEVEVTD